MRLSYPAIFYPADEGGYTVVVPDLPGCVTEGDDLAEAILMGIDAASGWILGEIEDNLPVPPPTPLNAVKPNKGQGAFVNIIALDIDEFARKHGKRTVKRSITIPAYLNTFAESQNINVSKFLQESLAEKYRQAHL